MITAFFKDNDNNWVSTRNPLSVNVIVNTEDTDEFLVYVYYPQQGTEDSYLFSFLAKDKDIPSDEFFPISFQSPTGVEPVKVYAKQTCLIPVPMSKSFEKIKIICESVGDNTYLEDIVFYVNLSGEGF